MHMHEIKSSKAFKNMLYFFLLCFLYFSNNNIKVIGNDCNGFNRYKNFEFVCFNILYFFLYEWEKEIRILIFLVLWTVNKYF